MLNTRGTRRNRDRNARMEGSVSIGDGNQSNNRDQVSGQNRFSADSAGATARGCSIRSVCVQCCESELVKASIRGKHSSLAITSVTSSVENSLKNQAGPNLLQKSSSLVMTSVENSPPPDWRQSGWCKTLPEGVPGGSRRGKSSHSAVVGY